MYDNLKRCVASIQDQQVEFEHLVMDGGSKDGTYEWLSRSSIPNVRWVSRKDRGMYDALNKGLVSATADIVGHLNADEQYLPGALQTVIKFFDANPEIDYLVADFLLVDRNGELISCRKSFQPFWPFFFSNYLYTFTCTLFYRKRVIQQLKYDDTLRSIADVDFMYKLAKQGFKGKHIRKFLSAFTYTGENLSQQPVSAQELSTYQKSKLPKWFNLAKPFLKIGFYSARVIYGTLWQKQVAYELYTTDSEDTRKKFFVDKPGSRWFNNQQGL
jgi:glycosyltransferase involved in cell wall biosynthesis